MRLDGKDAALYRLYAVGSLTFEEALKQAQSEVRLVRAMLHFDHVRNGHSRGGGNPAAEAERK